MARSKPSITGTAHTLPFDKLSPRDFERLCLWLVEREGFDHAEHLGAAGKEQGRDIVAWREDQLWAFQCKRVQHFGPKDAEAEVDKVLGLPQDQRPAVLVFLVTCDVSDKTRRRARARCAQEGMACHFWASTELDARVKRHLDILAEFFQVDRVREAVDMRGAQGPIYKLTGLVEQHFGPQINVTGQGAQVTVTLRDEDLRDRELAYLDGLLKRYEYWCDHYTPLAGIAEVRAAVEHGPRLDLPMPFTPPGFEKLVEHGFGARDEVRREPVDDLRAAMAGHRRILLLGDPGSGKTTTLWRLAYDYANAAQADGRAPLPLLVPLGGYTDDGPFDAYLARHLGPLAPYLETYRASDRLILLLDGLNEMPKAGYAERVGRIQGVLGRYPDEAVVVTCRALDYVVKLKGLHKVEVLPLDETRIRTFLHNYLGETAGERLFWLLAGGEEVRVPRARLRREPPPLLALGRNPYLLLMTAQVFAVAGGVLPANRARLFAAFVDTLLGREEERHPQGWVEAERQKDGLAALAYAMQAERGRGTTVERGWAVGRLGRAVPGCDAGSLLYLAASAMLLDADDETVRFYHQLLQEYFAAREMGRRVAAGEPFDRYWPPDRWWEPSGWEETAILLAGMEPDASELLERLAVVNPVVAARCLVEGGAQAGEAARRSIVTALLARMTDGQQPPVARVRAGDALASLATRVPAWVCSHLPCPRGRGRG